MSSAPAAMAKSATARTEPTPLSAHLPEVILIWEILVRLPPRNLVRCRAVCRAWRRITCSREFLLAHHGHQPSFPLLSGSEYGANVHQDIIAFDHRAAQVQLLARVVDPNLRVVGSCDGLLVMSIDDFDRMDFFICNPVTRQWGDLQILPGFHFAGIYPHRPTGQYRLLLHQNQICEVMYEGTVPGIKDSWYVLALGCDEVPRHIRSPDVALHGTPVLVLDTFHWYPAKHQTKSNTILAFNTTAESFRLMGGPVLQEMTESFEMHCTHLFEMDGKLGMYMHNESVVDIWLLQDYNSEVWSFKYRVKLPIAEIRGKFEGSSGWDMVVTSQDGDMLVLLHFDQWLLHIDNEGKLVASCCHHIEGLKISLHRIKQSLVEHTFFPALQDYKVDALPFTCLQGVFG